MLDVRLDHRWKRGGFHLNIRFRTEARCFALFGPSGVGKSSVLSCIAGLIRPQHGHVRTKDRVLFDSTGGIDVPPHQRRIGLVLQQPTLFPLHSVKANLLFGHPRQGAPLDLKTVVDLLEIGHLLERRPRNLSGGEQQRVALGRAILSNPRFLLADEPLSAVDGPRRDRLLELFKTLRDELEIPIVLVTHNEQVVDALADEVLRLEPRERPN